MSFDIDKAHDELKRLYDLGFAIHALLPRSKRPVEVGWTKGKRKLWREFLTGFKPGMNVGVRLGEASKIAGKGYLSVIDCDVKSEDPAHVAEMEAKLKSLIGEAAIRSAPSVWSGRGNGSRHIYVFTSFAVETRRLSQSAEKVKVLMPSAPKASRADSTLLSPAEIKKGYRMRAAWEISLLGEGAQVVLPPSIHPDSGKPYAWKEPFRAENLPSFEAGAKKVDNAVDKIVYDFTPCVVDLVGSTLPDRIVDQIVSGEGVEDRSAALLGVANSMLKSGFTEQEILSVLTDPENFLGETAYEHTGSRSRKKAAEWVRKYTLEKSKRETLAEEQFLDAVEVLPLLSDDKAKEQVTALVREREWEEALESSREGVLKPTFKNLKLILLNTFGVALFQRNDFAFRDAYGKNAPWGGKKGDAVTDTDILKIKDWLSETYHIAPPKQLVSEVVTLLCAQNSFHPVKQYLEAVEWDGKERVATWLKDYMGAVGPEPYLSQVSEKFLVAMIARIYRPGIKFDHTVVLEGAQGIGKSSAGRILAGDAWYIDSLPDLRDKDAALNLQGTWVVEMSELANIRNHESEISKAFLTRQTDRVRPPYGERWVELPRQCVFLGTTNADTYLKDRTGNRRFWPVEVRQCNFKKLVTDRDQLLSEAKWIWDNLEVPLYLEDEARDQATEVQRDRVTDDESDMMADQIRDFLNNEMEKPGEDREDIFRLKMRSLFGDGRVSLAPLSQWRADQRHFNFAAQALKSIGFEKYKSSGEVRWRPGKGIRLKKGTSGWGYTLPVKHQ